MGDTMKMVVTKVVINNYAPKESGVCAEVTVVLNDALAIHKISVVAGELGLFVAMPNTGHTRVQNNKKRVEDLVHPLNRELSEEIKSEVLKVYNAYKA